MRILLQSTSSLSDGITHNDQEPVFTPHFGGDSAATQSKSETNVKNFRSKAIKKNKHTSQIVSRVVQYPTLPHGPKLVMIKLNDSTVEGLSSNQLGLERPQPVPREYLKGSNFERV